MNTSNTHSGRLSMLIRSPLLWGTVIGLAFYRLIPHLPVYRDLAVRYFCGHPLEYATAGLFFLGMATLAIKALGIWSEHMSLHGLERLDPKVFEARQPNRKVDLLEAHVQTLAPQCQNSRLARRIQDVGAFIRGRNSVDELDEHLKYLAEVAADQLHRSYASVRTITWAVPILGFLGTVVGITIAIANVTPEQLDTSLSEVTGGLAVAFDTTALALMLSMLLVFASFVVERSEQEVLARVEEFGIRQLLALFPPTSGGGGSSFADAEQQAAERLIRETDTLIHQQVALWQESLESVRQRWAITLDTQQKSLETALQQGLAATLQDHSAQLAETRNELLEGYRMVSDKLAASMTSWQSALRQDAEALHHLHSEFQSQAEVLLRVVEQEELLVRLQDRLADNLQAVRAADALDETLHSLNAAVHLLTARAKPRAA